VLLLLVCGQALATVQPCPVTSGSLTLNCINPRSGGAGIAPLLVFFDCTATTDSATLPGANNVFQDVAFLWNFSDTNLISGGQNWSFGSRSAFMPKNVATGAIAAHLYDTRGSGDKAYTAIVTANDGTNTATCGLSITVFDPNGSNGFPGTATTCVAASTLPVAGSGDCPAGAAVLQQSSFNTALSSAFGSSKRVLFHCGDTFTGDDATLSGTKWSVGAYGGCEGTQTSQPIFSDTTSGNYQINFAVGAGDGRIADIFFNGNGTAAGAVEGEGAPTQAIPFQITLTNLQSTGNSAGYSWPQCAQCGLLGSTQLNSRANIAAFFNDSGNNPASWTGVFPNINYLAVIGDFVNGVGAAGGSGSGIEAMRTASCRLCVYENNTIENANDIGGVFKFNSSNTNGSCGNGSTTCNPTMTPNPCATFVDPTTCWTGFFTELIEISDNLFTGNCGGISSDVAPENGGDDERERNIIIERNIYSSTTTAFGGALLLLTAQNATLRDNVFFMPAASSTQYAEWGATVTQRGSGGVQVVQFNEAYHNTCFAPNSEPHQLCIGFDVGPGVTATANSFAQSNLFFVPTTATGPAVDNTGTGNTVSNNTVTVTNNPGFTNGSGALDVITDFKPTANFTISCTPFPSCTSVPVQEDALGVPWAPTGNLGAVHH
jgi:hypothetical protein